MHLSADVLHAVVGIVAKLFPFAWRQGVAESDGSFR